ncbi:hypothetical protein LTR16_010542, partial [Cryomyces antarcticus]
MASPKTYHREPKGRPDPARYPEYLSAFPDFLDPCITYVVQHRHIIVEHADIAASNLISILYSGADAPSTVVCLMIVFIFTPMLLAGRRLAYS